MFTAIGPWRLRSSGAHCARTLAVEVQRCSLRSGAGEGHWRGGGDDKEEEEKEREEEEQRAMIKSSDLHLAGGELRYCIVY